jgi:predicted nucleic acid-binding protein
MTTPLTEVGFVRIVANVAVYNLDVLRAKVVLEGMKDNTSQPLTFVPDADDVTLLPQWVKTPSHVTDGHLVQLARSNGAALATLDKGIPDAFLIPS